jgi:hypothetical protein
MKTEVASRKFVRLCQEILVGDVFLRREQIKINKIRLFLIFNNPQN